MAKLKASLVHFAISALIVGTVLAVIWFIWYPPPLFQVVGAWNIVRVLIVVDLILGPLLTLIVYRPGKPSLVFDLSVIAAIQLAALIYGTMSIYSERPCYMVFAVDRFETVPCKLISEEEYAKRPELDRKNWSEPLYMIAKLPEDPLESRRVIEEVLFEGKPDIAERPEFWFNYAGPELDLVRKRARPLNSLPVPPKLEDEVEALAARSGNPDALVVLPLTAADNVISLILDADTMQPVGAVPVDPWETK